VQYLYALEPCSVAYKATTLCEVYKHLQLLSPEVNVMNSSAQLLHSLQLAFDARISVLLRPNSITSILLITCIKPGFDQVLSWFWVGLRPVKVWNLVADMLDLFWHVEAELIASASSVFIVLRQFTDLFGLRRAVSRIEVLEFGQHRRVGDQKESETWWQTWPDLSQHVCNQVSELFGRKQGQIETVKLCKRDISHPIENLIVMMLQEIL